MKSHTPAIGEYIKVYYSFNKMQILSHAMEFHSSYVKLKRMQC